MMKRMIPLNLLLGLSILATGNAAAQTEALQEYSLPGMNVTALGYEKSNLETPADVTVYSGEVLKKTGASDVANALKYTAGVYFTQMGLMTKALLPVTAPLSLRGIKGGT